MVCTHDVSLEVTTLSISQNQVIPKLGQGRAFEENAKNNRAKSVVCGGFDAVHLRGPRSKIDGRFVGASVGSGRQNGF